MNLKKKSRQATMANLYLPNELVISILKRIPPKTLIKFLIVSKPWCALITDPSFISTHLHHHHHRPNRLLYEYEPEFLRSTLPHSPTLLPCPTTPGGATFSSVAGATHGVVCLSNPADGTLCLWNLTIRKHLNIDPIPMQNKQHLRERDQRLSVAVGFGFDSSTTDFKVVAISIFSFITCPLAFRQPPPPQAHVFSLSSGSWRTAELCGGLGDSLSCTTGAMYFNGVIHWVVSVGKIVDHNDLQVLKYTSSILTFDVASERFGLVGLPSWQGEIIKPDMCQMTIVDNSLALVYHGMSETESRVWVMKENGGDQPSWSLIYRIYSRYHSRWGEKYLKPEVFTYMPTSVGTLIVLDQDNSSSFLVCARFPYFDGYVFAYTESLALLDKFEFKGITFQAEQA